MENFANLPMKKLNDFILSLGNINDLNEFATETLSGLKKLIHFDQAIIYFLDNNQKIRSHYFMNVEKHWSSVFLDHYYKMSDSAQYKVSKGATETIGRLVFYVIDWDNEPRHEFIADYIRARGLKHSLNFSLCDTGNTTRTLFALDRIQNNPFTDAEIDIIRFLAPHLNNIHKRFFLVSIENDDHFDRKKALIEIAELTKREKEITLLLCNGISPASISKKLHIAPATAHKHITHIYSKMRVSNLQELLVYLFNPEASLFDKTI